MPWTEKYRPSCFIDVKGQDLAIASIKAFIKNFNKIPNGKKAILFYGPPGTGKTTIAYVTAIETSSEIFELNASDLRNKDSLEKILKPALEQRPISQKKISKIILVDEVDGISGVDRGGLAELLALIEKTKYPIILTANNIWDRKFNLLRRKCEVVKLKEINYKTIKDILICTLRKENLFVNNDLLTSISIKAKGDIRAALNDLQALAHSKEKILPEIIDERNKEIDIFNALRLIFKNKSDEEILKVFDSVNMPLEEIILWVEENIPSEYSGKELERAYDYLSRADVFKGRIYKQQYWRFLIYENIFLSYGISSAKNMSKTSQGFTSYKRPTRILKIWMHNQKTLLKKSISEKYSRYVHVGVRRAMNEFPIIKNILKSQEARKELKLSPEEIGYLDGLEQTAK
ncbi:MAG: replication factor C large subunit [Nanoarchaeota archaeon]